MRFGKIVMLFDVIVLIVVVASYAAIILWFIVLTLWVTDQMVSEGWELPATVATMVMNYMFLSTLIKARFRKVGVTVAYESDRPEEEKDGDKG